jgi:glycosyltransferase involved in cell wall biosynthesis
MKVQFDGNDTTENGSFDLSFVIPCLNEQDSIRQTLLDIKRNVPSELSYQIIVVDNGSVDQTVVIAEELGARVLIRPKVSVSELRNIGVSNAMGKLVVFIDADISLTEEWKNHIFKYYKNAINDKTVYGSNCTPTGNEGILNSCWFSPMAAKVNTSYVATGHMIISKSHFEKIGGFDPQLKTGEDYEFSQRARGRGFAIKNVPELRVVHLGFPSTVRKFFEREAWHGQGDLASFKTAFTSKVFLAAFAFAISHLLLTISVLMQNFFFMMIGLNTVIGIPIFLSFYKFSQLNLNRRIVNIFLNSIYLYGRLFSFFYMKRKWR